VSFFLWNVEGLEGADLTQAHAANLSTLTNNSAEFSIAKETGGRLVAGNDPARALQEFDTTSSSFYSLGYTPTHPEDGKYHTITVRLKQPGNYALAYRSGYSSSSSAVQLARAMTSPTAAAMQSNALGVTLALGTPAADGNDVKLPIEVKVPFRALQFLPGKEGVAADLVVYVSVFNDVGKNVVASSFPLKPAFKSGKPDLNGVMVYRNAIKLRKGERQRIVVAVRDNVTDTTGMATNVVKF
jgi:hypothetical protein